MITVVNEPEVEYKKTNSWQAKFRRFSSDEYICKIENETVIISPPSGFIFVISPEKAKRNLSALRGKTSKQSKKEIDDQISDLRSEWNRDI
ncbi:MAG: hypothetical protein PHO94_11200 [Petrimonas sp.]|nr:hypothetical protein [Petrimonas sp.]